jgi:hypothetical protein
MRPTTATQHPTHLEGAVRHIGNGETRPAEASKGRTKQLAINKMREKEERGGPGWLGCLPAAAHRWRDGSKELS